MFVYEMSVYLWLQRLRQSWESIEERKPPDDIISFEYVCMYMCMCVCTCILCVYNGLCALELMHTYVRA